MFKNAHRELIKVLGLLILSANASAVTITFDSIPASWSGLYDSVTDSGFRVTSAQAFFISDGAFFCSPQCPENGTHYLISQWEWGSGAISVSATNGGLFGLTSFQYAEEWVGEPYSPQIDVVGHTAGGGTITASYFLDGINDGAGLLTDFQTALLPIDFQNLTSVDFKASYGYTFSLDNVVTTSVPSPPTLALLIPGVAFLFAGFRQTLADQSGT